MKIILLIHVRMPTIVGILTFISRINTTYMYESLNAKFTNLFRREAEMFCSVELKNKNIINFYNRGARFSGDGGLINYVLYIYYNDPCMIYCFK